MSETEKGSRRLKQLTQNPTWTSPFRSEKKKKTVQDFKDSNSVRNVLVPKKFTSHPTLPFVRRASNAKPAPPVSEPVEPSETDETGDYGDGNAELGSKELLESPVASAEAATSDASAQTGTVEQVDPDEAVNAINDRNHSRSVDPAVGTSEDDIQTQVDQTAIELDVDSAAKYELTKMPNQEVLDNPKLYKRYQELNRAAIASVEKSSSVEKSLDDPNKLVDLGCGLKLAQHQLLDIAAKRVAPLITSINEEVAKTREENHLLNQQELDFKVARQQSKLKNLFSKHVSKCEKQMAKMSKDHEAHLKQIADDTAAAMNAHKWNKKLTDVEIETANSKYAERERKAVEKHELDKNTLLKNHTELEATKQQCLQACKDEQLYTAEETEKLKVNGASLDEHNVQLETELAELAAQLEQREKELKSLQDQLYTERITADKTEHDMKEIEKKMAAATAVVEANKEHKGKLALEVGALAAAVAAYSAHLVTLQNEKSDVPQKLSRAREVHEAWNQEKKELAIKTAREHEQRRLEAKEAAATERYKAQLEEEKRQLETERRHHMEERQRFEEETKKQSKLEAERLKEEKRVYDEEQREAAEKQVKAAAEAKAVKGTVEEQPLGRKASEVEYLRQLEAAKAHERDAQAAVDASETVIVTAKSVKASLPASSAGSGNGVASKPVSRAVEQVSRAVEPVEPKNDVSMKSEAATVDPDADISTGNGGIGKSLSLKKKLKNIMGLGKDSQTKKGTPAPASRNVLDEKQPATTGLKEEPEVDLYSLYEEVSDDEFDEHQNDLDYLEVEEDVAEKLLRKNRV